jgi:SynChlorMet cassette protein ScmD
MNADTEKPVASPGVVLREEFDEWAILFEPDTGATFGLNPTGVLIWQSLDGTRSLDDICGLLRERHEDVPEDVEAHVSEFVRMLGEKGLLGREVGS